MKTTNVPCEICSAIDWRTIGAQVYRRDECRPEEKYRFLRFRALFEKWFPGRDQVEFTCVACRRCGFVITIPRPEQADMDAKYVFLYEIWRPDGSEIPRDAPIELRRSTVVFDYLSKQIDLTRVEDVLDYGGGDGRMMRSFVEHRKSCFNVDYHKTCIPGVTRLGDTLDDVSPDKQFDLIICSHVMEHVVEPLRVIERLATHLRDGGWIFVEVPMEIWRGAPLQVEPVTHVNFFTPNSMWNMLTLAGLHVQQSHLATFLHASRKSSHAVRAVAQRTNRKLEIPAASLVPSDVEEFLNPGFREIVRYYALCPSVLVRRMKRRILRRGAAPTA
jgi:2-polyprenyl-3-methyl-5-hydroxy-6-metoxy-1,4-benzoquinol methylase